MAPTYDFDQVIDRRTSDCTKWSRYGDALPMWVADMDFRSPQPIIDALQERVAHGVFGYGGDEIMLKSVVIDRLQRLYGWTVTPEEIVPLPGLVCGLNVVCRAIGERGDGVLVNTPVYPPFLTAPINQEREVHAAELCLVRQVDSPYYQVDYDALEAAIQPNTQLFILCNPHNPTGRAYSREELKHIAEICQRHDLVICSDEIHAELLMEGTTHIPLATLAPEIADRTITVLAPSKTFNIPGLGCSLAIISNPELREQFVQAANGIVPHVNLLGISAAIAAYSECDDWLGELLHYLEENRDFAHNYVKSHFSGIHATLPEATYLMWLDCRETGIEDPYTFFLEEAGVALNDGTTFGPGGKGFVRLNLGCPRAMLAEALHRMRDALAQREWAITDQSRQVRARQRPVPAPTGGSPDQG